MHIEIRRLREEDVEALAAIEAESFSMPWSRKDLEDLVCHPCCRYLVALADGRVAGGCGYTVSYNEITIDNVVVAREYRHRGIAQAMLSELIAGEEPTAEAFTLEVRVSNAVAIHIYEKNGFRSEGIRPGFYEKPREDAMIMWRRKIPGEGAASPQSL